MEGVLLAARALIVTYNSEHVIGACLEALAKMAPSVAVTVIDNASSDRSAEIARRPGVEVVANRENRGFAGAVNQGFRGSPEDVVIVLNPDVELASALDGVVAACREHGLAAGLLHDADGRPQAGFSIRRLPTPAALSFELLGVNALWPGNPVNRHYRYLDRDLAAGEVEQPAGAFLAIRRDVWETLGGFDDSFFPVWFEDVDFCRRARLAGYRIWLVPEVWARHVGGHSVKQIPEAGRTRFWYGSLLRYAAKHFRFMGYRGVCLAALCSVVPRFLAGMLKHRSQFPITTCIDLLSFTGRRLVSPRSKGRLG